MNAPERRTAGSVHAGVAIGVLAVAGVAWNVLVYGCTGPAVAVPPPKIAVIREHRLCNFPKSFGDFELYPEAEGNSVPRDKRDGVLEFGEEEIETLGIARSDWNWYYMATYRDKRLPPSQPERHVCLRITYYTEPYEPVPHVPERAITASAARIDPTRSGPLVMTLPGLPHPWSDALGEIWVQRTAYAWTDRSTGRELRGAMYHFFIVNGRAEHRWEAVCSEMTSRLRRRCCFAKIEVGPAGRGLDDMTAVDAACREFLRQAMPVVVRFLPSRADLR